jgi:hypothetical protein
MTILVATVDGLHDPTRERPPELGGHDITALDASGGWAVADGKALHQRTGESWREVAVVPGDPATALVATPSGVFVGTAGAHLLRLDGDALVPVPGFDTAPGRDTWGTPWGGPPDVRSMAAAPDGTLFINVHVGGVVRSRDDGATWAPTIDVDADVHQVIVDPRTGAALVAAAVGFAQSSDGGDSWRIDSGGMHATYSRAIAVAGGHVLLTSSDGPFTRRAALYRRPLGSTKPFEQVTAGLPEWFEDNVDSHWIAACGDEAALVTEDGGVFASTDAGTSWNLLVNGLPRPRAVVALP